jgi:hypothetical protein
MVGGRTSNCKHLYPTAFGQEVRKRQLASSLDNVLLITTFYDQTGMMQKDRDLSRFISAEGRDVLTSFGLHRQYRPLLLGSQTNHENFKPALGSHLPSLFPFCSDGTAGAPPVGALKAMGISGVHTPGAGARCGCGAASGACGCAACTLYIGL